MAGGPIDAAVSVPVALAGRIVTMDAVGTVLEHGVLYARGGAIIDIRPPTAAPPPGFADVAVTQTRGTLFPGLIELHNHLPYDVLKLWPVPRRYTNRDQWSGTSTLQYRQLISGPMRVLGADPDVVPAIVRYVEMRALLGGTTTSQGVALAKAPGIISHFRGLVRNVESTHDSDLPPATTHIADIDADHFLARLSGRQKLILHLSEGIDTHVHDAFAALHLTDNRWVITDNLIGIHCLALTPPTSPSSPTMAGRWSGHRCRTCCSTARPPTSPLRPPPGSRSRSDRTGRPQAARTRSSNSRSRGSRLAAHVAGTPITDRVLVAMLTTTPARVLGWDAHLGSLEPGKRADLIVVAGVSGDPYAHLVDVTEADLHLVMINGVARVGTSALIGDLVPGLMSPEPVTVAGRHRVLNLAQTTADPDVAALTVHESLTRLQAAPDGPGPPRRRSRHQGGRRVHRRPRPARRLTDREQRHDTTPAPAPARTLDRPQPVRPDPGRAPRQRDHRGRGGRRAPARRGYRRSDRRAPPDQPGPGPADRCRQPDVLHRTGRQPEPATRDPRRTDRTRPTLIPANRRPPGRWSAGSSDQGSVGSLTENGVQIRRRPH